MNSFLLWLVMSGLFLAFGGSFWFLARAIEEATTRYVNTPEEEQ